MTVQSLNNPSDSDKFWNEEESNNPLPGDDESYDSVVFCSFLSWDKDEAQGSRDSHIYSSHGKTKLVKVPALRNNGKTQNARKEKGHHGWKIKVWSSSKRR